MREVSSTEMMRWAAVLQCARLAGLYSTDLEQGLTRSRSMNLQLNAQACEAQTFARLLVIDFSSVF